MIGQVPVRVTADVDRHARASARPPSPESFVSDYMRIYL